MVKHKTLGYIRLRSLVFKHEIQHFLKQIEQFMLLTVFFLGTAIQGLLFLALLAFGVVLDNESSVSQLLFIVWALLTTQSLMLLLFKQAILGHRYAFFLASFYCSNVKKYLCDIWLATLCNPIIIMYLFIIGSISPQDWPQIPHGFLLLYLLLSSMLMNIYKPQSNVGFLAIALLVIPLVSEQSLIFGLLLFSCCQLVALLFSSFQVHKRLVSRAILPTPYTFWFSLARGSKPSTTQTSRSGQKHDTLLIACAIATIVIVMTNYVAHELPQFTLIVHAIGASFIILATTSVQLSLRKISTQYPLFFNMYVDHLTFSRLQYWVSAAATFCMLCIAAFFFQSILIITYFLPAALCIFTAQKHSRLFVIIWITTCLLTSVFLFIVSG
jgi:hypothetical protein